jgi:molecular chaperone DnaK
VTAVVAGEAPTVATVGPPMVAVDVGSCGTKAFLVHRGTSTLLTDPAGGPVWPTAVCATDEGLLVGAAAEERRRIAPDAFRAGPDPVVVSAVLAAVRDRAAELAGEPVDRLVATDPAVRDPAQRAGFVVVESLPPAVAAAGAVLPALVCDFGARSFTADLVRGSTVDRSRHVDADVLAVVADHLRAAAPPGPVAARLAARLELVARSLLHRLSDMDEAEEYLLPDAPPCRLARETLAQLAEPLLAAFVGRCRELPLAGVRSVVAVGGLARLPFVIQRVANGLQLPVRRAPDPELTVARGIAAWTAAERPLVTSAKPPRRSRRPLAWALPTPVAHLARWLVEPDTAYPAGAALARVRLPGGALWDLTALEAGRLVEVLVAADHPVASGQWLAVAAVHPR